MFVFKDKYTGRIYDICLDSMKEVQLFIDSENNPNITVHKIQEFDTAAEALEYRCFPNTYRIKYNLKKVESCTSPKMLFNILDELFIECIKNHKMMLCNDEGLTRDLFEVVTDAFINNNKLPDITRLNYNNGLNADVNRDNLNNIINLIITYDGVKTLNNLTIDVIVVLNNFLSNYTIKTIINKNLLDI